MDKYASMEYPTFSRMLSEEPMWPTLTYRWQHIPTGKSGTTTTREFPSRTELQKQIARWNDQLPHLWHYEIL